MTLRFKNDLLFISTLVILLIIVIAFFESSVLRIILGLPYLLFFPGYTLLAALFPRKNDLGSIERVALSSVLSIAVVAGIGVILNYTVWGIRLYPILVALTVFVLATSIIAWVRRWRLAEEERLTVNFAWRLGYWRGQSRLDKILIIILIVVMLGAAGSVGYAIANPKEEGRFTEFYILGPEGKAEDYPEELRVGETATVIVVVVNHEYGDETYRVEITIGGNRHSEISQIVLGQEEKWQRRIFLTPVTVGEKQKVEFVLYRNREPYRRLQLWVDVTEQK